MSERLSSPAFSLRKVSVFLLCGSVLGAAGFFMAPSLGPARERSFEIRARQYQYDPPVLRVNRGDTVRLRLVSEDVVHGFYLEGHDLDAVILPLRSTIHLRRPSSGERQDVQEVVFTASREGKFRYRCSQTCGYLHPFMLGELIVGPNRLFPASVGAAIGMLVGGILVAAMAKESGL